MSGLPVFFTALTEEYLDQIVNQALEIHATGMGSDLTFGNQPGRVGSR
jgi:hypothetical protein